MSEKQLNSNTIGESIRRSRKQKGMTQEALAQVLSVSAQAVSKWETGQSLPDIGLLLPLSKALGVGVNDLLGGSRRQELEKKFQSAIPFGEEHTLLVTFEALEEFPDDETFLYRRACDELFLGERDMDPRVKGRGRFYLDQAIQHFQKLHYRYPENETYTVMLVRAYRALGRMEEAKKLAATLKDPANQAAVLQGEDKRRYRQQKIREAANALLAELATYGTRESVEAYQMIAQTLFGKDLVYRENYWNSYSQQARLCHEAGDTEGFIAALEKAYELAKQYDGLPRGRTSCKAPLFDLLQNEVTYKNALYLFLDSGLLQDCAAESLKQRFVNEQVTYHTLWRHEWIEYFWFCQRHICGLTWMNYSTQYDYEVEFVPNSFRFRGYQYEQMCEYYRTLVERLVGEGIMTGYCAYFGNTILAYINCKDKEKYFSLGISEQERAVPTTPEGSKVLAIVDTLIAPALMKSGIGEKLLEHTLEQAKKKGYTHVETYVLEGLISPGQAEVVALIEMYKKAGFRIIRDFAEHERRGLRHYIMQKCLDDPEFEARATRFTFGDYVVDVDVKKTREIYKTLTPVPTRCKCDYCANYEKVVSRLPAQVRDFFESLGVDLTKITESVVYNRNRDGSVHHGGWLHVCGKVVKGKKDGEHTITLRPREAYGVTEDFKVWFSEECLMVEKEFGAPVMQIDFETDLPWVLDKKILENIPIA